MTGGVTGVLGGLDEPGVTKGGPKSPPADGDGGLKLASAVAGLVNVGRSAEIAGAIGGRLSRLPSAPPGTAPSKPRACRAAFAFAVRTGRAAWARRARA